MLIQGKYYCLFWRRQNNHSLQSNLGMPFPQKLFLDPANSDSTRTRRVLQPVHPRLFGLTPVDAADPIPFARGTTAAISLIFVIDGLDILILLWRLRLIRFAVHKSDWLLAWRTYQCTFASLAVRGTVDARGLAHGRSSGTFDTCSLVDSHSFPTLSIFEQVKRNSSFGRPGAR